MSNIRLIGRLLRVAGLTMLGAIAPFASSAEPNAGASSNHEDLETLTTAALSILRENCHRCHGVEFKTDRLNVLDRDILLDLVDRSAGQDSDRFLVPKDRAASMIWQVINDDQMPPKKPLSENDKQLIGRWIDAGAPWEVNEARPFISELETLQKISQHLFNIRQKDRKFQRYFTLAHVHNNRNVTKRDLQIYRAALSKAVNSMSSQASITVPVAIDDAETLFNIDLRHYGWQEFGTWEAVLKEYPYGLKPDGQLEALDAYKQIEELYGDASFDGIVPLRADWFVATATRPPLYHKLTNIPETLDELLKRVGVDVEQNFKLSTSRRAGLFESGVSGQNRMIEYHSSTTGTFWLSYDFDQNEGRGNLARFPLGPVFEGNEFENETFVHAGGEIIFNLPNGLHAYMLVDGKGARIDAGPVNIVWDAKNISGSPLIVNGLSCMSCHKHGMLPLTDFVRDGSAVQSPEARRKVQELYATQEELNATLLASEQGYLQQLQRTIAKELGLGPSDGAALKAFEEPVSRVTQLYNKNLDLETVACELGMRDRDLLKNQVFSGRLVELGLGPLALEEGTIKRAFWDSKESTSSIFQEAAGTLRIGTPISN